jgi:Ca-activated chloride channel family protein
MAADRGVRIDVIGLGRRRGRGLRRDGLPIYMRLDEPTLQEVARMTGGECTTTPATPRRCAPSTRTSARAGRRRRARPMVAPFALDRRGGAGADGGRRLSFDWFGRHA